MGKTDARDVVRGPDWITVNSQSEYPDHASRIVTASIGQRD
jgi:hypothetical protein